MKGRTDWKILKKLAEISPKSYAAKIRRRNEEALKVLDKAWKGKKETDRTLPLGCPHCKQPRSKCLWLKAIGRKPTPGWGCDAQCLEVKFGGVQCNQQHMITLGRSQITIRCWEHLTTADYQKAHAFLLAHIEWADKFEWGKKYKPAKKK